MVLELVTRKKHLGFRTYNTQIRPGWQGAFVVLVLKLVTQKKLGRWVALVVLVLQVAQRKKPMMMSAALIVMVLDHVTQKKDQDDER